MSPDTHACIQRVFVMLDAWMTGFIVIKVMG